MPAIHMSQEPRHALEPKLLVPVVCPTDDSDTEENTPSPASPAVGSGGATITSRRGSDKSRGGSSAVQEFRTDFRSRPGSSGRNRMITHAIDVKGKQQQQQVQHEQHAQQQQQQQQAQHEQHAQQQQQQQQRRHQTTQPQQHHPSREPEESQHPALNVSPPRRANCSEHSSGAVADGAIAAATAAATAAGKEAAAGEGAQVAIPKRVSFVAGDGGVGGTASGSSPFRPSYEVFTPGPHALGTVQYRAPEKRVPSAVAPPSSVARPNYHDAIRRVAVVVFQHVQNCERRLARVKRAAEHPPRPPSTRAPPHTPLGGGQPGGVSAAPPSVTPGAVREAFDPAKADLFHERHYVSPRYRCTFVRALGAAGALPCSAFAMAKVETEPTAPSVEAIYEFIRTLFNRACLSSECSLVCLIYIERLMEVAAVPLLATTWKPVVLCGLLLASKVWQDLSSWNVEFSTVYPEFSLRSINRLEHVYLAQVQWDLYISASLYAKYYFALRSLAEGRDFRRRYNCVVQIDAPRADRVQERSLAVREEAAKMFSKSL